MKKIVITGGAGLVGQNLVTELVKENHLEIVVIDKNKTNLDKLKELHPKVTEVHADLSVLDSWTNHFFDAHAVVMLQAQIGGLVQEEFVRNNVVATQNILQTMTMANIERLVHVSSSVVESVANDWYTETKKIQEELVESSKFNKVILRPTLMFGWFDRKHLGWLSRFMKKVPVFPIPGNGRYIRQPLYAGDFSRIIANCINDNSITGVFNISGREEITYVEIIKTIKKTVRAKTLVVPIPKKLFRVLLTSWALMDKNPPFTTQQLDALLADDRFEDIDWPTIFSVEATTFPDAVHATFNHPRFSQIVLEF